MKVLVISDVHGNLPALEIVLKKERDWDLCISLGDVVNYGPWSNECVDLLESLNNKVLLKGNHETYFLTKEYENKKAVSYDFFKFCLPTFNRFKEIAAYHESYKLESFNFIHTLNNDYIFPDTELRLNHNTFLGHSHRAFNRVIDGFMLVNPGSVGQNRAFINEINYAILWPETKQVELKSISYDVDQIIQKFKELNYPEKCISYYADKKRSNE